MIFAVVAYYAAVGAQLNSFVPTIVAVFLPLSGMWASVRTKPRNDNRINRAIPVGASDFSSNKTYGPGGSGSGNDTTSSTSNTLVNDDRSHVGLREAFKAKHVHEMDATEADLEMQHVNGGVVVDRSYSVRSD